jgi:hypothetical protein
MSVLSVNLPLIYALPAILGLILLDLVLGIAASFKTGTFSLTLLPLFLQSQVLTYYLPIIVLVALAQVNWAYFGVSLGITTLGMITAAWAAIGFYVSKVLIVNIGANLSQLFGIAITVTEEVKSEKGSTRLSALLVMLALVIVVLLVLLL